MNSGPAGEHETRRQRRESGRNNGGGRALPTSRNSQMEPGGLDSRSWGQCLIPREVCPSGTSAHSSVTELKRISF